MRSERRPHLLLFWGVVSVVLIADIITKYLAVAHLPPRVPQQVLGLDWFRFTLVYNKGAAFGIHLGHDVVTRIVFVSLTFVALYILWKLYSETRPGEQVRVLAISLVTAGALGNLIDRLRSAQGVVDFLDVGVGLTRWPTFNIADMGVSCGAVLLAVLLWKQDPEEMAALADPSQSPLGQGSGDRTP